MTASRTFAPGGSRETLRLSSRVSVMRSPPETERTADGQHELSGLDARGVAKGRRREVLLIHLQHRHVGVRVRADDLGPHLPLVSERDADLRRVFDHVVVGEQVTVLADDHTRPETLLALLAGMAAPRVLATEELAERRIVRERAHLPKVIGRLSNGSRGI